MNLPRLTAPDVRLGVEPPEYSIDKVPAIITPLIEIAEEKWLREICEKLSSRVALVLSARSTILPTTLEGSSSGAPRFCAQIVLIPGGGAMLVNPSEPKNLSVTTLLAVWGAILSSFTFGWTLYRDVRDRAKIKLSANVRRIGQRGGDGAFFSIDPGLDLPGVSKTLFLVVSVVNVGRRPIRWRGVGGHYRHEVDGKGGFVINARFLPKMLEEQESHEEFTELDAQFTSGNVKGISIWDVAGRKWSVSRRDIRKLLADAERYSQF